MRIAIDVREACKPVRDGKGQWTYGFVRELVSRHAHDLVLYTNAPVPADIRADDVEIRTIAASGLRWHWRTWNDLRHSDVDLYLSPTSFLVPAFLSRRIPCIPVVHDLIAWRSDTPHNKKAVLMERLTLGRTVRRAKVVACISASTQHDLQQVFPSVRTPMSVVYAGPFRDNPPASKSDGRTIVCIGTLCPRKNQLRLIQAFASLPASERAAHRLVLAGGRGWHDDDIVRLAHETDGVEWVGRVSDMELENILATAHVFALPSLYEGFGLPVLDAMQRGIPVLTSKEGSLAEVAGDAAMYCDPHSAPSIAEGLQQLLVDDAQRMQCREAGLRQASRFSWKKTVDLFDSMI